MADIKSARVIAEERAIAQGELAASFKEAGVGAVRSLEMNNITVGETVTIPVDYKIIKVPIAGSTNKAVQVITEEGKAFWVGCLTRGAMPADGSAYVRPKGTVVEKAQEYGNMDDFWDKEMRGKKIKFEKKEVVVANAFDGEGTREVNVWTLNFVP
jgi:hypothetical protein